MHAAITKSQCTIFQYVSHQRISRLTWCYIKRGVELFSKSGTFEVINIDACKVRSYFVFDVGPCNGNRRNGAGASGTQHILLKVTGISIINLPCFTAFNWLLVKIWPRSSRCKFDSLMLKLIKIYHGLDRSRVK